MHSTNVCISSEESADDLVLYQVVDLITTSFIISIVVFLVDGFINYGGDLKQLLLKKPIFNKVFGFSVHIW